MKLRYSAGWNLPGCLPEMEPATFDNIEDAYAFIKNEKAEARLQYEDTTTDTFDGFVTGDPYEYWVEEVVLDDCPFCETGAATVPVWQAAPLDDTIACEDCAALSLPNV